MVTTRTGSEREALTGQLQGQREPLSRNHSSSRAVPTALLGHQNGGLSITCVDFQDHPCYKYKRHLRVCAYCRWGLEKGGEA